MSLVYNGEVVATNVPQVTISREKFLALSDTEKNDPNINYFVYDDEETDYERIIELISLVGSVEALADTGYDTIIEAIVDINRRLGGLSFNIDPEVNHIQATYSDEVPNNEIFQLSSTATDAEKIEYFEKLLGDAKGLKDLGYDSVIAAILDILEGLNGLEFKYNNTTNTVEVTDTK